MVMTKTPFRMSFFGGGTDIEDYFFSNGGAVLSTSFDKYCYIEVRHLPRFFEYKTELIYNKTERVNDIDEIEHPLIRNGMKMLDMHNIRLSYDADLPARSGLGTSSSFAVGMLNAFHALKGTYADKKRLANEAIILERRMCKESGGWQDQIATAYGGLNRIDFDSDGFHVKKIILPKERKQELDNNLIMFFTGFTRLSSDIQKANNICSCETKKSILSEMRGMVDEAEEILSNKNCPLDDFGKLLGKSWELKRKTGEAVTTSAIDEFYERGIKAGAIGGKLLGAGGGGFLIFYVPDERRDNVCNELQDLMRIPFHFESNGSEVIYFEPEEYEIHPHKHNIKKN